MPSNPEFRTMWQLLSGRLFRIPEYQRAYTWQTKHRKALFDDIKKVRAAGGDSSHFLATIVGLRRQGRPVKVASDEFVQIEVVDGQQRLTTIAILLKALSKALRMAEDPKSAGEIDRMLVKGDDLRLLLLQTNHDLSHIFVDYLRQGIKPKKKQTVAADQNLVDAIAECERFVEEWAETRRNKLLDLYSIIKNRLTLIFHQIEEEAFVYTVFEVLNSRGLNVTAFDRLKSQLMAIVFENSGGGGRETVRELHSRWSEVYRTIGMNWRELNRETVRFAGTLRASDCPNRSLSEDDSVKLLVDGCEQSPKKVVDCTKWVLRVTQEESRLLGERRLAAATEIVHARLLAIAVFLRGFPAAEEESIIRLWESVTFRIYGLANKDARSKRGEYVRLAWRILNDKLPYNSVLENLRDIGEEYPIAKVVEGLRNHDCYTNWTEQLCYFFFRYEEDLARKAGQSLNASQWNKIWEDEPSRSIEHICPQSRGSKKRSGHGIFVHRLGNLMLLPPGMNSALQNKRPTDKASRYGNCGLLLATEVGKLIQKGGWSRAAVERREKRLARWAAAEWKD